MTLAIRGKVWYWRGPAPFYFVTVPPNEAAEIKAAEKYVTYGWGMIPAQVRIGETVYRTALWPKDGLYAVPLRASVRKAERIEEGMEIVLLLEIAG